MGENVLVAVIATAEKGKTTFQQILKLRNEVEGEIEKSWLWGILKRALITAELV